MRERHFLLTAVAVLAVASLATANIIGDPNFVPDGDGVITAKSLIGWTGGSGDYTLTLSTKQQFVDGYGVTGHVGGQFNTDGRDPTVYIIENVENATSFAWTGYLFSVYMQQSFNFVTSTFTAPTGWTASFSPVTAGTLPNMGGPGYMGTVTFSVGTGAPVAIGGNADFGVKFKWLPQSSGYVGYCTEQTPTPEPATLAILGLGGMALLRKRR